MLLLLLLLLVLVLLLLLLLLTALPFPPPPAQLSSVLERFRSSQHTQSVAICGELGVGKSALRQEAVRLGGALGIMVLQAEADAVEGSTPLFVFRELLEAMLDVEEERLRARWASGEDVLPPELQEELEGPGAAMLGEVEQGRRLRAAALLRVFCSQPLLASRAALLGGVLSSVEMGGSAELDALSGELRQSHLYSLIVHWVRRFCRSRPLLLAVEDGQHLDPSSRALFARIVGRDGVQFNLVLIVVARSADELRWMMPEAAKHGGAEAAGLARTASSLLAAGSSGHEEDDEEEEDEGGGRHLQLLLRRLSPVEVDRLVMRRWNCRNLPKAVTQLIHSRASGNPLETLQIANAILASGLVCIEDSSAPGALAGAHCAMLRCALLCRLSIDAG